MMMKSDILYSYVAYCRCMCMFYILYINDCYYEMDVLSDLQCMINYFIIVLPCIVSDTLYVAYHRCTHIVTCQPFGSLKFMNPVS
jgi:hypothetical protein